jgi:hypothetical protein
MVEIITFSQNNNYTYDNLFIAYSYNYTYDNLFIAYILTR